MAEQQKFFEVIRLCEPALRTGQIAQSELSVAPFGYYGWHLYPYYIEHDGANGGYIADFEKYLARDSLVVSFLKTSNMGEIRQSHETTTQEGVLATGFAPVGFRGEFIFTLRRTQNAKAASLVMDLSSYRLAPYPLNDSEWRRLIDGKLH